MSTTTAICALISSILLGIVTAIRQRREIRALEAENLALHSRLAVALEPKIRINDAEGRPVVLGYAEPDALDTPERQSRREGIARAIRRADRVRSRSRIPASGSRRGEIGDTVIIPDAGPWGSSDTGGGDE